VVLLGACGDDAGAVETPLIVGPYGGNLQLEPDTYTRLPPSLDAISPGQTARFYWYHPGAAGRTITFEVRAETTALAHGTVIHTEAHVVPGGSTHGMVAFEPRRLSQGGARRGERGQLEWLDGIYSVKGRLDGGEHFATGIFEVR
jgi:hypothetical protein